MADEGFLRRWARLKSSAPPGPAANERQAAEGVSAVQRASCPPGAGDTAPPAPAPTLEDVAALTADSDFAPFIAREVDADVRRGALRKLFTDPHFNRMDGLDVYIGDYTQASPMPAAMLAGLDHARTIFGRPADDTDAAASAHDGPQAPSAAADEAIAAADNADDNADNAGDATPMAPSAAPTTDACAPGASSAANDLAAALDARAPQPT